MQEYDIFSVLVYLGLVGLFFLLISTWLEKWLDRKVKEYEHNKLREANKNVQQDNQRNFDESA